MNSPENQAYKQAASEKKSAMAQKMLMNYTQNARKVGKPSKYTMTAHSRDGEKYSETGHKVKMHGGEKAIEAGTGGKSGRGQKPNMANTKGKFTGTNIYTQTGK